MAYAEIRIQRELQRLRREVQQTKEQERQTRQGCLDLADALEQFVTSLGGSEAPASAKFSELVSQAKVLFAPAPSAE